MANVHIIGDTHGNWSALNEFLHGLSFPWLSNGIYVDRSILKEEHIVIVCGDFGYWPKLDRFGLSKIKLPENVKVYFCPGNHEDWESLSLLPTGPSGTDIVEVRKGIYYCPFGSTLVIDGKTFLFCGGADSVDKHLRTPGYDWFAEEIITDADMDKLPNVEVDVVISHTCPSFLLDKIGMEDIPWIHEKYEDPSCKQLDIVFNKYRPEVWHFGHFHQDSSTDDRGCCFFGHKEKA